MEGKMNELREKMAEVEQGGGPDKIEKQHEKGKLTARERIALLFDEGSFNEIDTLVTSRYEDAQAGLGEGVVTGYGTINQRLAFAYSQDFTMQGGSLGEMHAKKISKVMDLALKNGAPLIGINDSGGARIQEGVDALSGYGQIFYRNTISSGVIPQISVIAGPSAGGAVYSPALTDFIFMIDKTSRMFITGPQVIKMVTGEEISSEQLGGAMTHNKTSGVAHFMAEDENACFAQIKELLEYLPSNNLEDPPCLEPEDDPTRETPDLLEIVPEDPNRSYDVREVISRVVDHGKFLEVQAHYAQNIVIGYARLNGKCVGIVANQPRTLAGCLDINCSDKAARFIRFCDAFNIPLINLVDVPGFLPGKDQEYGGIIRHGAKMLYAYSEATVPKITLIMRKVYGGAYLAMCSKDLGADQVLAWPIAEIAVMGPEGAANIIYRKEIEEAKNTQEVRDEKIKQYRDKFANPYIAASRGYVDAVIEPQHTRCQLINSLEMLTNKREERPQKKHGNLPV